MSKDKESDRLELIRQNNQQPNNNQHFDYAVTERQSKCSAGNQQRKRSPANN